MQWQYLVIRIADSRLEALGELHPGKNGGRRPCGGGHHVRCLATELPPGAAPGVGGSSSGDRMEVVVILLCSFLHGIIALWIQTLSEKVLNPPKYSKL